MKFYTYVLGLLLFTFFAKAQDKTFVIQQPQLSYNLSSHVYLLVDSTQQLDVEQAKNKTFLPVTTIDTFKEDTENTKATIHHWYKIIISNQQSYTTNFVVQSGRVTIEEFYVFDPTTQLKKSQNNSEYRLPQQVFSLQIPHKDTVVVFVKAVANVGISSAPLLNLTPAPLFYEDIIQVIALRFVFQGAMWIMFFYNLLFFLIVRDRAYGYYALYIMSMAIVSVDTYIAPRLASIYNRVETANMDKYSIYCKGQTGRVPY